MLRDVSRVGSQSSDDTLSKSFSITIMNGYRYPNGPGYNYNDRHDPFDITLIQVTPNSESSVLNMNDFYAEMTMSISYYRSSKDPLGELRVHFNLSWSRTGISENEVKGYVFEYDEATYNVVTGPGIYDRGYVLCKVNPNTDEFKALFKNVNTYFYNTQIKAIKLRSNIVWSHTIGDLSSFGYKYTDKFGYLLENGSYVGVYYETNSHAVAPYFIKPLSSGYTPCGINNYGYADIRCEALELLTEKNFLIKTFTSFIIYQI